MSSGSESHLKDFEKSSEVLPFNKYGLSAIGDFKNAEHELQNREYLKMAKLTDDEIKLYLEHGTRLSNNQSKIETNILKSKLQDIHKKIEKFEGKQSSSTSDISEKQIIQPQIKMQNIIKFYPEGHPMNELKELEESLFGHLKTNMLPITKRLKVLRHFERRKQRIMSQNILPEQASTTESKPGSLWDVKEKTKIRKKETIIGPKKQTLYTIKDNKIVRLEPTDTSEDNFKAVDITVPTNTAEANLLEGTKMTLDDIRKIERFKDYEPGTPSKTLYLKNIASGVQGEQLSLLFNQFVLANGGPVEVLLMTGRMRGQAFVYFNFEEVAMQALDEINGTILSGRPIIVQFGKNRETDNS